MSANPPQKIFDRTRLAVRLGKTPGGNFVMDLVREDLAERLAPVTRTFQKALAMGPDARALPAGGRSANGDFAFARVATLVPADGFPLVDSEALVLPETGYDLVVSLLDLQSVNDVPGFLARIRAHLAPDGLMIAAAIGGNSLKELRAAWLEADAGHSGGAFARVAPFIDVRDAGSLLQRAGFALPVADLETHVVRYASPLALMREIKSLGAANPLADRPRVPVSKGLLAAAAAAYTATAADADGRVRATLEVLWLSAWAPHESQQKPLKPGSAEVSLAKVLKTKS